MSKSFDFVKQRYGEADWAQAVEVDAMDIFSKTIPAGLIDFKKGVFRVEHDDRKYDVHVHFDPDADFDYYTTEASANDSTLVFAMELYKKIVAKVITLQTCYKPYEHGNFEEVYWTIGNFVYLGETCEPQGKPWLTYRMTVLLPLKMEVK